MEKKMSFEKDDDGRWYAVIPEWDGERAELEMVLGADTMLDLMSEGGRDITLEIRDEPFEGSNELLLIADCHPNAGAYYRFCTWKGESINMDMWLCDVMLFVFGGFPNRLYIK